MARVRAKRDIRSGSGKLLLAGEGREGYAIRKPVVKPANYNKVAVQWDGRKKVYWHRFDDLEFLDIEPDPHTFIAFRPDGMLDIPIPAPPEFYAYHFGANLRQFREEQGIPQWRLADLLTENGTHVSQTTISYWERSAEAPNGSYVAALAEVLNRPVFLFFINFRDCDWLRKVRKYLNVLADAVCEEVIV